MANIFNVARYILQKQGNMSTWKLQKLCYYCQAWSLVWDEKPLFKEDFEAWANGPVCRELFYRHKGKFNVSVNDFPEKLEDAVSFTEDELDTIDKVLHHYGNYEPFELREQTHIESPWIEARNGCPEDIPCSNIITKDSMGAFYGSL